MMRPWVVWGARAVARRVCRAAGACCLPFYFWDQNHFARTVPPLAPPGRALLRQSIVGDATTRRFGSRPCRSSSVAHACHFSMPGVEKHVPAHRLGLISPAIARANTDTATVYQRSTPPCLGDGASTSKGRGIECRCGEGGGRAHPGGVHRRAGHARGDQCEGRVQPDAW